MARVLETELARVTADELPRMPDDLSPETVWVRMQTKIAKLCSIAGLIGTVACAAPHAAATHPSLEIEAAPAPRDVFWENLQRQCGEAFSGRLTLEPPGDGMLTGTEELVVHFRACEEEEVRVPFHIEKEVEGIWDRSRTWVFMRHREGLELRHDHRRPDGTEDRRTWYGGFTAGEGTAHRQDFASPERTARAGVPVGWRVEIVPGERYTYGTTHDGDYDWRIDFDLSRPIAEPPPPWGHRIPPTRRPGPP